MKFKKKWKKMEKLDFLKKKFKPLKYNINYLKTIKIKNPKLFIKTIKLRKKKNFC